MTRHVLTALVSLLLVTAGTRAANADERLERIMLLWPSRDPGALRVQIHEALTAYQKAHDPRREAITRLFLGLVDNDAGDTQNTRLHFGEAASGLEGTGDYVGAWLAYWMLAEYERLREGQSDQVLAFYDKSFAMLEKARAPSAPFLLDAVLVVGPVVGLPPAEYEGSDEAIALQLFEVFTRTGYGAEFVQIGELEKAETQLQRAKKAAAIFGGRIDPPIDFHIGNLRRRQWRLDEARESYGRAFDGLKVLRPVGVFTPKRLKLEIFGGLSEIEMLSGRIDGALAWNNRALELVRAEGTPLMEVIALKWRAEILVKGGRFAAAEKVFAQARTLAEKKEYFDMQVFIGLSSATMNRTRGRYGAAAADLEKSLEALAKTDLVFPESALLSNLAMTYILLDADNSARLLFERARQAAERDGRCLLVAAIDLLESARRYLKNEITFAELEKAAEQWARTPDARTVPGSDQFTQLITAIMGSVPVDPQLAVRSGMFPPGMVEILQAAALFSEGRELPLARELAMKGLALDLNPKYRAAALPGVGGGSAAQGGRRRSLDGK